MYSAYYILNQLSFIEDMTKHTALLFTRTQDKNYFYTKRPPCSTR